MAHIYNIVSRSTKRLKYLNLSKLFLVPQRTIAVSLKVTDNNILISKYNKFLSSNKMMFNRHMSKCEVEDEFNLDSTYENSDNLSLKENNVRETIYSASEDPVINLLSKCNSIQAVFDILSDKSLNINYKHYCQAIVILWDLQNVYLESYVDNLSSIDINICPSKLLDNYTQNRNSHQEFINLLTNFSNNINHLNLKETVASIFYLKGLKIKQNDPLYTDIFRLLDEKILSHKNELQLKDLTKYTYSIKSSESLKFAYNAIEILPKILEYLHNCKTAEGFYYITLCLYNIHLIATKAILELYKAKCNQLLESKVITNNDHKTILQILQFYNLRHWFMDNFQEIYHLCNLITPVVKNMNIEDIISLHKVFKDHLEPQPLLNELKKKVTMCLEEVKCDDRIKVNLMLPNLLYFQITTSNHISNTLMKEIVHLIKTSHNQSLLMTFDSLRYLKITDPYICEMFWKRITDDILMNNDMQKKRLYLCHMYIYFCYNIDGVFRSNYFENVMTRYIVYILNNSSDAIVPWKLCRIISFLFIFQSNDKSIDLNSLIDNLYSLSNQLTSKDILYLSKSYHLYQMLNKRRLKSDEMMMSYKLKNIIRDYSDKFLKNEDLSIFDLTNIFKSNIWLEPGFNNEHFDRIFHLYNNISANKLSSIKIRNSLHNFNIIDVYPKKLLDNIVKYCVSKQEYIYRDTILNVLIAFFNSGLNPGEEFFNTFADVFDNNKEETKTLKLLDYSLALCYFQKLPESIINYIFSMEFMEKLDKEISLHSTVYFSKIIRQKLMILNRAVCLELPEYKIPWFHQKHIQESIAFHSSKLNYFQKNVLDHLTEIIGSNDYIDMTHFTPYGYHIDFYLQRNASGNFVTKFPVSKCDNLEKIAIILQNKNSLIKLYDIEDETNSPIIKYIKSGKSQLKRRHLELMGYRVIEIFDSLWNSMQMAEPKAKLDFLNSHL